MKTHRSKERLIRNKTPEKLYLRKLTLRFGLYVGILAVLFSGLLFFISWKQAHSSQTQLIDAQAQLGLEFDVAIRNYVARHIRPYTLNNIFNNDFIPETMSTSYVARSIFDKVREKFPSYIIKFSSDDPRNPLNKAGAEELKVIQRFNQNPALKEYATNLTIGDTLYRAHFRSRRMEKSCLQCHGDPQQAPPSMVKLYGDKAGFHRPLGEVIALDMVAIPETEHHKAAFWNAALNTSILVAGLVILLTIVFWAFVLITRKMNHHAEEAEQSHQNLLSIFDGLDEVIYVSDPVTYEMLYMNRPACRTWGADRLGEKCYAILQDRTSPCPFCTNDKLFDYNAKGTPVKKINDSHIWEFKNERNNRWYRCIDKAIRWSDGRCVRYEMAIDIDDNKRYEQKLKDERDKADELAVTAQAANQAKSRFLANLSHELRTPMNAVFGFTEILTYTSLNEEQRKFIDNISCASKNLMQIIDDMLDLAQIEANKTQIVDSKCNINELLETVDQMMRLSAEAKGLTFTTACKTPSSPDIMIPVNRVRQCLLNLTGNAIKFTETGSITLSGKTEEKDGGITLSLRVKDTGIGISEEKQKEIFDSFVQVDGSYSRTHNGLGLGLTITKRLVTLMGGTISVESSPGEGADFTITLPVKTAEKNSSQQTVNA